MRQILKHGFKCPKGQPDFNCREHLEIQNFLQEGFATLTAVAPGCPARAHQPRFIGIYAAFLLADGKSSTKAKLHVYIMCLDIYSYL